MTEARAGFTAGYRSQVRDMFGVRAQLHVDGGGEGERHSEGDQLRGHQSVKLPSERGGYHGLLSQSKETKL